MAKYGYKGFAKIYRSIMALPMYHEGEFDKAHALLDLMLLADSTASVETSLKALKTRWFWGSERRVRHFLESLSASGIASVKIAPYKGVQIRINTEDSVKSKTRKNDKTASVSASVLVDKESSKEDRSAKPSPISASTPQENNKNWLYEEDFDDE